MPHVNRWEWKRVIILAVVVVALSYVPYYVGFHHGPAGKIFGGFVLNELDGNTYLAAMQQGIQGQWQFHLLYTSEEHRGSFLYLSYILLGHLAGLLGSSAIAVYHSARLVSGFLLLLAEYVFIAFFLALPSARWIAYLLSSIASGLGWLVMMLAGSTAINQVSPIDFWLIDAYTFFSLLHAPHFCLALALLLMLFMLFILFVRTRRWGFWAGAAIAALGLAFFNPYVLLIAGGVLAAYWCVLAIFRRSLPLREACGLVLLAVLLAPPLLTYYLTIQSDPVLRIFAEQDVTLSPAPFFYVMGYGLIFFCALIGAVRYLRWRNERDLFLLTWVIVVAVALYLPLNIQRRMIVGLQVPLGILATVGLVRYVLPAVRRSRLAKTLQGRTNYPPQRLRIFVLNLIIVLTLPSVIYLWTSTVAAALTGYPDLFQSESDVGAIDWLGVHSFSGDVILSSYRTGNYIPARIGRRVFLGHWDETADYTRKSQWVEAFFREDTSDDFRTGLLREHGISFVFWGDRERALGQFQPGSAPYLRKVFRNDGTEVYRVEPGDPK